MIRRCDDQHFELICAIINDGALVYPVERKTRSFRAGI
jgi:hypothetical protein